MIERRRIWSRLLMMTATTCLLLLSSSSTSSSNSIMMASAFVLPAKGTKRSSPKVMVMNPPREFFQSNSFSDDGSRKIRQVKKKFKRRRIPESEKQAYQLRKKRQQQYESLLKSKEPPSIWSFESLFPEPIRDEQMIRQDLNMEDTDANTNAVAVATKTKFTTPLKDQQQQQQQQQQLPTTKKMRTSFYGGSSMMRIWREPKTSSAYIPDYLADTVSISTATNTETFSTTNTTTTTAAATTATATVANTNTSSPTRVDRSLTRMVEDRIYGYRRTSDTDGTFEYDTSLMGDGAVQFRDGIRLGNPLPINTDRLNWLAKKEIRKKHVEEAKELYQQAIQIDPRDGRAYLGLSRCAERRRDFKLARECLQAGIANSRPTNKDRGANPFLLQALGCLEERMGHLSQAEELYIAAAKSRPSHAAAWVSLAQLRTRKLGQSVAEGRVCLQTAERELQRAGMPPSAHVYTAWGDLEFKKASDMRRARKLFQSALEVDPKCSAALLQLGVLETKCEQWDAAQECFERVLKFDQRNSRVMQAYALCETKRPGGDSRKAIGLFERALAIKPRDGGVLQAYGLYVADELGDVNAGRDLLRRGTEVNKRHAPIWQAWGVLEMRQGNAEEARNVFQQGIWSCAQLTGSQSGGHRCARLWQAWGVLEAKEGNHAAARRCFSRALDADSRNVPTITAWVQMEEELGNEREARFIYEQALGKFSAGSDLKMSLWRSYELMEQRLGDKAAAKSVYQRAMREAMMVTDNSSAAGLPIEKSPPPKDVPMEVVLRKKSQEVEVSRWDGGGGEVWLNDKAIEAKMPRRKRPKKAP